MTAGGMQTLDTLRLACQTTYGFHPFTPTSLSNRTVLSLIYEPMFVVNSQYQAEPLLAKYVSRSDDGLTTTVTLRTGVYFHDGSLLTSEDVLYSYEQAKASSYYGQRFPRITEVTAKGVYTISFTTDTTFEAAELLLDFPIIPEGSAEDPLPPGTGPFILDLETLELNRFDRWWDTTPPLGYEKVELLPCTTSTTSRDNFEYGQVHLVCTDPNAAAFAPYHTDSDYAP